MKTTIIAAGFAAFAFGAQAAPLLIERFSGDGVFDTRCNQGVSNQDCEFAVAEGRAGSRSLSGDWEFGLGVPFTTTSAGLAAGGGVAQYDWAKDVAFTLEYVAATQALTFSAPGATPGSLSTTVDLASASSIFIRARGLEAAPATLVDIVFNGHALGSLSSAGVAEYLAFTGFGASANWLLSGKALAFAGGSGSAPSFQIKLTDAQVIPLPAAAWLMLSGLGALFGVKRLKRAA